MVNIQTVWIQYRNISGGHLAHMTNANWMNLLDIESYTVITSDLPSLSYFKCETSPERDCVCLATKIMNNILSGMVLTRKRVCLAGRYNDRRAFVGDGYIVREFLYATHLLQI